MAGIQVVAVATGLREWQHDLDTAPGRLTAAATAVVSKGALNIKREWSATWAGQKHTPGLTRAIDYDMIEGAGTIAAEIGVNKSKYQGPLGNFLEFGSVNNGPQPGGSPALASEGPRFVLAMEAVCADALSGGPRG